MLRRSSSNYIIYLRYYGTDEQSHYWNNDTSSWQVGVSGAGIHISTGTWYEAGFTFNPATQKVVMWHEDIVSDPSDYSIYTDGNPLWWFCGFNSDVNYYGQLYYDYITVTNSTLKKQQTLKNSLTTDTAFVAGFDGSSMIVRNHLMEGISGELTLKNDLLQYNPVEDELTLRNWIGAQAPTCYTPTTAVILDGDDITDRVESWSIAYESFTKMLKIKLRERDFLKHKKPYLPGEEGFDGTRVTVAVNGDPLGDFFWETAGEQASDGYGADIEGRSGTAFLDRPYTENVATLYGEDYLKSALIEELADPIAVDYRIIDTVIPADTYSVRAKSRIAVIKEIAGAGGGEVYTDAADNLIVDYKKEADPLLFLNSSRMIDPASSMTIPTGENRVEVTGYSDEEDSGLWPYVRLVASKDELLSDGNDRLKLTAYCYKPGRVPADTETIEYESATPSAPNQISVSNRIKRVIGVWEDSGGSPGDRINGPYTFDGTTITTKGEMLNIPHLVSYVGGETCSFSVDQLADLAESSVLIENGKAQTELRASDGGGGYITVTASYRGIEAEITINLDDPSVGGISASAESSDLATGGETVITARAWDRNGYNVPDGTTISFEVFSGSGTLSAPSANTTTSEITEEVVSESQVRLSVDNEIDTLISIYLVVNGEPYTGVNYADYATVEGNTVELSKVLSSDVQNICQVIYESGGTAQVTFTAPASGSEVNWIRCSAGSEDCLVKINVAIEDSGSTTPTTSGGSASPWKELPFSGTFKGSDKEQTRDYIERLTKKTGYKLEVKTDDAVISKGAEYIQGIQVFSTLSTTHHLVVCTVVAKKDEVLHAGYDAETGKMKGTCKVYYGSSTDYPLEGIEVYMDWAGDTGFEEGKLNSGYYGASTQNEMTETNKNGVFHFYKGIVDQDVVFFFKGEAEIGGETIQFAEEHVFKIPAPVDGQVDTSVFRYYPVEFNVVVKYRYVSKKPSWFSAI